MAKKLILGAVLGGLILFVWGAISHMLLPVSNYVLFPFTNEEAVKQAVLANVPRSGVYFLPYVEGEGMTEAEQEAAMEKAMQGPVVFASIRVGRAQSFGVLLVNQLLIEMLGALIATALLLNARPMSYGRRVLFVVGIALAVGVAGSLPEWNWYSFSTGYTLAEFFDLIVGWALAGLALAHLAR
ncbi:MAG TPA: hypothetical protein VNN18_01980 [Candidatus Xenobia bacterium]|nr:hypothetical protein [Candidatus Xenobia bacterium]